MLFAGYVFGYVTDLFSSADARSLLISIANHKTELPFYRAFLLGIPANILVCLAFFLAIAARDVQGKVIAMYLPIIAFVASDFQHCVAVDFFFFLWS